MRWPNQVAEKTPEAQGERSVEKAIENVAKLQRSIRSTTKRKKGSESDRPEDQVIVELVEKIQKAQGESFQKQTQLEETIRNLQKQVAEQNRSQMDNNNLKKREFVLKKTFKNVRSMRFDVVQYSAYQHHYGYRWHFRMMASDGHLVLALHCFHESPSAMDFEVSAKCILHEEFEVVRKRTISCNDPKEVQFDRFLPWDIVLEELVSRPDSIRFEISVKILKTSFGERSKLRDFSRPDERSDVVLNVSGEKFHVTKAVLESQSAVFQNIFSEDAAEFTVDGFDVPTFQCFLEALYGFLPVNKTNVEDMLRVSAFYRANNVTNDCERFLRFSNDIRESVFMMLVRYKLNIFVKDFIAWLSNVKTIEEMIEEEEMEDWIRQDLQNRLEDLRQANQAVS